FFRVTPCYIPHPHLSCSFAMLLAVEVIAEPVAEPPIDHQVTGLLGRATVRWQSPPTPQCRGPPPPPRQCRVHRCTERVVCPRQTFGRWRLVEIGKSVAARAVEVGEQP